MSDHLRIVGRYLDERDLYVDAVVTNVDLDGNVKLDEDVSSAPRTWSIPLDELNELREQNYAVDIADLSVPDHGIWSELDDVYQKANDSRLSDIDSTIETQCEELVRHVIRATS